MPTLNGKTILSATVSLPATENWRADVQHDGEAITGTATLDFDGVQFVGTVLRSGAFGGRGQARVVGGKNGLSKSLPAKNYANGPTVKQVVQDILASAGETMSTLAETATLAKAFPKWQRVEGAASDALRDVLSAAGASWRMEPDGTVWVGVPAFPAATPSQLTLDEDYINGTFELADAVELRPTFSHKGFPIRFIQHSISAGTARTRLHIAAPGEALERIQNRSRREIDYSSSYPARVSKQNSDGTLELVADDTTLKGAGLDRVPYRLGVPGTVKVSAGQRVRVAFDAHDPSRPYCYAWEGGACTELALAGGSDFVALAGLVTTEFTRVKDELTRITTATATGLSGVPAAGAALAAAFNTSLAVPPIVPSPPGVVAATKVKAE